MKTQHPNEKDATLRALLREWKPDASLPPRFQEQVWRRIERTETAPAPSVPLATALMHWIANVMPRPALATAYVTVLLVLGTGAGWSQARQETARVAGELGARYAQAVDPYQLKPQP